MELSKGQRNELFKMIEEHELNVHDFELENMQFEAEPDNTVGWRLKYKPRPEFYFVVMEELHGIEVIFRQVCPGEREWQEQTNHSRSNITPSFNQYEVEGWLERIKAELEDDLWQSLADGTYTGKQRPETVEVVQDVVDRIILQLNETNLSVQQKAELTYHFNLTVNIYKQNPKFDWKGYIIGTITSAVINMTIDTLTGKTLFGYAIQAIRHFLLLN